MPRRPQTQRIPDALAPLAVPIDSIHPDPENAREHDSRSIEAIAESLRRFGQQKPIVVDGNGRIIAGNGQYAAAKQLGWTEIAVHQTTLEGEEADAFAIADNRTQELSVFNPLKLRQRLSALGPRFGSAMGFNENELRAALGGIPIPRREPETAERGEDFNPSAVEDDEPRVSGETLGSVEYRLNVLCPNGESDQARLASELESRGYECRMFMS